ncbi:MAG: hypothetical protein AB1625_06935 [Acidobacteriota bacterium]
MLRNLVCTTLALAATPWCGAQVATAWTTATGVPVAVVELPAGDLEHIALFVPPETRPPSAVAGWPVKTIPRLGGAIVVVSVPASASSPIAAGLFEALAPIGAASVVAFGPAPVRELGPASAALDALPFRPPAGVRCELAEGATAVMRGTPERVEIQLEVPGPGDMRHDLLPAFSAWVETRLQQGFPGARVVLGAPEGCSRLLVQVAAGDLSARTMVGRLREALDRLGATAPEDEELAALQRVMTRRHAELLRDGAGLAVQFADRLARGGTTATAFSSPHLAPTAIASLATTLLRGRPGLALVWEAERRAVSAPPQLLDNGVVLAWRFIAGDTAVVALALGSLSPGSGRAVLELAAADAARRGWAVELSELAGVPALAVAVPSAELTEVVESLAAAVTAGGGVAPVGLDAGVARALALGTSLTAQTVSVAMLLPEENDEAQEAAMKFFGGLAEAGIVSSPTGTESGLDWTPADGTPSLAALVEFPATPDGWVAAQTLIERIGTRQGASARLLGAGGRLVLDVRMSGEDDVPALDRSAAKAWASILRPVSAGEVAAAAASLSASLYGDTLRNAARVAAAAFLPSPPRPEEVLAVGPAEVSETLAALPRWLGLPRLAVGPAPAPGRAGVRESPPPRR